MIRTLITILTLTGMLAGNAFAEPSSLVAFDVVTVKRLKNADPARGEELARAAKCRKCHGDNGVSDDPEDVNIAGLRASYIFKQLQDYKDKKREARDMYKVVRDMDEQQMADLAAWYASQPPASTALNGDVDPAILRLVTHGDPRRLLKACAACHGRDGRGGQFDHPALTGQYPEYLLTALEEFKEGDRENDVYARMRDVAEALTDEEIEGLVTYYAMPVPEEEQ